MLYNNELISNPNWISVYAISCLCFRYNLGFLGNLSIISFFACDGGTCAIKLSLVTQKKETLGTSLYLISHLFQLPFLLLDSILSKIRPMIFICLAILKCAIMYKWLFNLALEAKIKTKNCKCLTFSQPIKLNRAKIRQVNKQVNNGQAWNKQAYETRE